MGNIFLEALFSALDSWKGEASWRLLGLKGWSVAAEEKALWALSCVALGRMLPPPSAKCLTLKNPPS